MNTTIIVDENVMRLCEEVKRIMTETPLEGPHDPRIQLKAFFDRLDTIDDGTGQRYIQFFGDRIIPLFR